MSALARPALTVLDRLDSPAPPWWQHRLWQAREAACNAVWTATGAVVCRVATTGMRQRAWAAGFALALGDKTPHRWLSHLDEHGDGNGAAWDLRRDRGDHGRPARDAGSRSRRLLADLAALLGVPAPAETRAIGVVCCPFVLPPALPLTPPDDDMVVVAQARHAAPAAARRRAGWRQSRPVPRHARPRWPRLAALRLRQAA